MNKIKFTKTLLSIGAIVLTISTPIVIASCNNSNSTKVVKTSHLLPQTDSYYILSSSPADLHFFDESNTPITNFCAPDQNGYPNNSIIINGLPVDINDIYTITIGSSYGDVAGLGDYFFDGATNGFSSLNSIDFSGLSSLQSVGNDWMYGYNGGFKNLKCIDLEGLSSLTYVANNWMDGALGGFSSISSIYVGGLIAPAIIGQHFCSSWPTNGGIYGIYSDQIADSSWKQGGISNWECFAGSK